MRVVVAFGPDALLRMGQPMTAGNQRESARLAFDRLVTIADKHELNLSHQNGPQIGQPGMIGYLVEQELENRVPLDKPLAALLTRTDKDRAQRPASSRRDVPWAPRARLSTKCPVR
jgi:carbamate kinase